MKEKGRKWPGILMGLGILLVMGCTGIQMKKANLVYDAKNKISEGDLKASVPILKKALALDPKDKEANVAMAQAQYRLDNIHGAERYAQVVYKMTPRDFRALGILGLIDLREGAYERGINRVSEAMKIYNGIEEVGGNLPVEPQSILKEMQYELKKEGRISRYDIDKLADAFWAKIDWYEFDEEYRKWYFKSFYDTRPDGGATVP